MEGSQKSDQVDSLIQEHMQTHAIPGLSLAIVEQKQIIKACGYGLANVELSTPATPSTVYQIQSMTKSFVATGVMLLAQEGRLHLDDAITTYLPQLPPSWSTITLHHLLTMTSGIQHIFFDHPSPEALIAFTQQATTSDQIVAWATARPLHFTPGEQFRYSSTNYHLLGLIIQKVSGCHWGEFLHKRIFEPLGMTQTRVVTWPDLIPQRAAGYIQIDGSLRNGYYMTPAIMESASGGLYSTIFDLAKWDVSMDENTPVAQSLYAEMWQPARLNDGTVAQTGNNFGYGLGWWVLDDPSQRIIAQAGDHATGFTALSARFVNSRMTIILLTNLYPLNLVPLLKIVAEYYIPSIQGLNDM